nr:uncharacterized protein LOC109774615 [Aegilops tauschii subsp. strangulata]
MEHHLDEKSPAAPATLTMDGKEEQVVNFERSLWYAQQQQLQGYLMGSLFRNILAQVATLQTPAEVWRAIHAMFVAQSQAQAINTSIKLTNLQKGNMTMAEYLGKIKSLTDEVACTTAALSDPEIVSKILAGLDMEYNPVVSALAARVEPITVQELYSQLLSFDARPSLLHGANIRQSSAISASRGLGRGNDHQGQHSSGRGRGNNDGANKTPAATAATTTGQGAASTTKTTAVPLPPVRVLDASFARRRAMKSCSARTVMMKIMSPMLVMLLQPCVSKDEKEFASLRNGAAIDEEAEHGGNGEGRGDSDGEGRGDGNVEGRGDGDGEGRDDGR